jgi:fructuronate reductase
LRKKSILTESERFWYNETIFGVNLCEAGLGEQVEQYFKEMNKGIGAVRRTLEKYCKDAE